MNTVSKQFLRPGGSIKRKFRINEEKKRERRRLARVNTIDWTKIHK